MIQHCVPSWYTTDTHKNHMNSYDMKFYRTAESPYGFQLQNVKLKYSKDVVEKFETRGV